MARPGRAVTLQEIDWGGLIRPGELVVWSQASAEPVSLTESLIQARSDIGGFRAFVGISYDASVNLAHTDRVHYSSYCGTGWNHRLGDALDILPVPYARLAPILAEEKPVLLISVAPGADPSHFSFGAGGDYPADLIDRARLVIAELNLHAPRTGGGRDIAREQLDLIVQSSRQPPEPPPGRRQEIEQRIAGHIAQQIEDGSTIQIGLGAVPSAAVRALASHRDIGVHSGMIGDEVAELVEAGVITNARKSIDRGATVTGLLAGGTRLMDWASGNAALAVRTPSYTHDPVILRSIDRFVAINSAIEVDLSGQVNAETAAGRYVGAVGGAGAFLRGASDSHGGIPIIALPSTTSGRSRIVSRLSGPVSTARSDIGLVITEHGIADLRGASLRQRQDRILAIVDPQHRSALLHELTATP